MTTGAIAALAVGIPFVAIFGAAFTIRLLLASIPFREVDLVPGWIAAAVFWPVVLPAMLAISLARRMVRPRLPEARVVPRGES